jgi:NADH:ubiquinone oxidoreductase subunit C
MLFKKYQFPINIFICFEKLNPVIFTSEVLTHNHYVALIPKNWYYGINLFLKKELFYSTSTLTEISAIDTLKYSDIIPKNDLFNVNDRFIVYNIYYFYFIKIRLTLLQLTNDKIESIDTIYNNANWLERETSEMFGVNYLNKKDNRALLLDYSRNEFPMLKDFPTEGYYEIYFDFFENKLSYVKNEFIEL